MVRRLFCDWPLIWTYKQRIGVQLYEKPEKHTEKDEA